MQGVGAGNEELIIQNLNDRLDGIEARLVKMEEKMGSNMRLSLTNVFVKTVIGWEMRQLIENAPCCSIACLKNTIVRIGTAAALLVGSLLAIVECIVRIFLTLISSLFVCANLIDKRGAYYKQLSDGIMVTARSGIAGAAFACVNLLPFFSSSDLKAN